jgi:hypothetical protein
MSFHAAHPSHRGPSTSLFVLGLRLHRYVLVRLGVPWAGFVMVPAAVELELEWLDQTLQVILGRLLHVDGQVPLQQEVKSALDRQKIQHATSGHEMEIS